MRLCSVGFVGADGPVTQAGWLVDGLTSIIGRNDAGKSRLTSALIKVLAGDFVTPGSKTIFIVEMTPTERDGFLLGVGDLDDHLRPDDRRFGELWSAHRVVREDDDGEGEEEFTPLLDDELLAIAERVLRERPLNRTAPEGPSLAAALARSRLFALVPDDSKRWAGCAAYWCLPDREVECAYAQEIEADLLGARPGSPVFTAGPRPLVYLGWASWWWREQVPRRSALLLPLEPAELSSFLSLAVASLAEFLVLFDAAQPELEEILSRASVRPVLQDNSGLFNDVWLDAFDALKTVRTTEFFYDGEDGSLHVLPDVAVVCELVGALATSLAPGFIRNRYEIRVRASPRLVGSSGPPLMVGLAPPSGTGASLHSEQIFPLDSLADGFELWIHLALCQAAQKAIDLVTWFAQLADAIHGSTPFSWDDVDDERSSDAKYREFPNRVARLQEVAAKLRSGDGISLVDEAGAPLATTVFVLDEPERALHPRVHRQLAKWLRDLVAQHGGAALATTHSPHFMNASDALLYVRRDGAGEASATVVPHDELLGVGEIATALGLDRGELLASTVVFLFVEGRSDQLVLETLFGDVLRREGVAVVPLQGATKAAQIIDSNILLRWSTARAAFMVDDLSAEFVEELRRDPELRREKERSRKPEEKAVANLLGQAKEYGREVTVVPLPCKDIFFALDEDAIRATFKELGAAADYPGHAQFLSELRPNGGEGGKHWKDILERRYSAPKNDVGWYERVAARMLSDGTKSDLLDSVCNEVVRLTFEA